MRKDLSIIAVVIICIGAICGLCVSVGAEGVGYGILYEYTPLVMPHSLYMVNAVDDWEYAFRFDESITLEPSTSEYNGLIISDTLRYNPADNEEFAFAYVINITKAIEWGIEWFQNFKYDANGLGCFYIPSTNTFVSGAEVLYMSSDSTSLAIEVDNNYTYWLDEGTLIVFSEEFEELYLEEYFSKASINIIQEPRWEINVTRNIELISEPAWHDTGYKANMTYAFSGFGLVNSNLEGITMRMEDESCVLSPDDTSEAYDIMLPVYTVFANATQMPYSSITKEMSLSLATGYTTELRSDNSILKYYQTYENITLSYDTGFGPWQVVRDPFLHLEGSKITNVEFPTYTNPVRSDQYLGFKAIYSFNSTSMHSQLNQRYNGNKENVVITFSDIPVIRERSEAMIFESGVAWGWLDADFNAFSLVSFLDSVTFFFLEDLFGIFSIADILLLIIGIALLFALLKFFVGG